MSLKEFDAKQFLLEKGEQVGLGVALTLMVLMLILSLFWPQHGFFSGSPAAKASELNTQTKQLNDALATRQPGEKDLPEKREGKLIRLETAYLAPDNYATEMWYEPRMKENKARRPPKIYTVEEAVAAVAAIPIDTYLFRTGQNPSVLVLQDKNSRAGGGMGPGGNSPFANLGRALSGAGGRGGSMPGSGSGMMGRQQQLFGGSNLGTINRLQSAADNTEYEVKWIPLDEWNPQQQQTAHQLRPLRMAIIAGSFPYKKQIEEHQKQLHLKSTDDVLNETIGEGEKKSAAFDFRSVEVERQEVDADGKVIRDWENPQLKDSYQMWLQATYIPFEQEDQKYAQVRPNDGKGLVMPLLREFHAKKAASLGLSGMMLPGMMGGKGMPQPNMPRTNITQPTEEKPNSHYPDVFADLSLIKKTLDEIEEKKPKLIAEAKKFQKAAESLDVFNADSALPADKSQTQTTPGYAAQTKTTSSTEQSYIPDYVLVRVVDVNIEAGKYYRYRLKVRMANPNYENPNVASPEYKLKETLESSEWYELPNIVKVPQELFYYVADDAQGLSVNQINRTIPAESAHYRMLRTPSPTPTSEQVVFQFHRWVETTQQSKKDTELIPVGEWAVADRVFVARGEYIGRKVNIDIPIWKYSQNLFILPAEEQKIDRRSRKPKTGIDVDFGQEPQENNLILVDFEGGKGTSSPTNSRIKDDCAVEVLMLSPDGKLLARNSAKDTTDKERIERREKVLQRIKDVREGKGTD